IYVSWTSTGSSPFLKKFLRNLPAQAVVVAGGGENIGQNAGRGEPPTPPPPPAPPPECCRRTLPAAARAAGRCGGELPPPLPPLEVAVAGAGAALLRLQLVRVHAQAHATARLPPFRAGGLEHPVQPLGLRLDAHLLRPRDHQHANPRGNPPALEDAGRRPQIL